MNRLVFGVGINDSDYVTSYVVNGKRGSCPFYIKWTSMIERCYSSKWHEAHPTYKGCTVCDDWLSFSWFKCWMENQDWQGKQLDKDILIQGNKIYSPGTCLFVESNINSLFIDCKANRGKYKIGVSFHKHHKKFVSKCRDGNGVSVHIGYFSNEEDAHEAYKVFKYKLIAEIAEKQTEPLRTALLNYKIRV